MKQSGSHNRTRCPARLALANRALNALPASQSAPQRRANSSTKRKPALWRVRAYSSPGLPKPTIRCRFAMRGAPAGPPQDYFLAAGFFSAAGAAAAAGVALSAAGAPLPAGAAPLAVGAAPLAAG